MLSKRIITFYLLTIFFIVSVSAQKIQANIDYIEKYHKEAIAQQKKYKIPASITLAQGILESGAGKGRLAVKANNHFGIKCSDWSGAKIYHNDDRRNECFRKYKSPLESYEDHSKFLVSRDRYSSLWFESRNVMLMDDDSSVSINVTSSFLWSFVYYVTNHNTQIHILLFI